MSEYFIQNTDLSSGNRAIWWSLDKGYTAEIKRAQKFTFEEATNIYKKSNQDVPWLASEIEKLYEISVNLEDLAKIRKFIDRII